MKSLFYLIAGCTSLAVGLAGIILPILPTTPLLLLAGFCFARSSKRFEKWLRSSRIYQFYVADYAESKSISASRKKKIVLQIYLLMAISIYFAPLVWVKIALFCLTLFITYYLFRVIPDKKE
ncbi:YbaN family protein [Streptococcus orisasini]